MDVYIVVVLITNSVGIGGDMGRKTFISYKFSEAQCIRDIIIRAMGEDAQFYQGETSDSPDLTDTTSENIKRNLADMIYNTSVTIVIISPHIIESKWIPWEIQYSLCEYSRNSQNSKTNGIVGVITKVNNSYDWFINKHINLDGCHTITYNCQYLPNIIKNNMFNQVPKRYSCQYCKSIDSMFGHFISLIKIDDFLINPTYYIENAYDKAYNKLDNYIINKDL